VGPETTGTALMPAVFRITFAAAVSSSPSHSTIACAGMIAVPRA
jgi:hypothetical protein